MQDEIAITYGQSPQLFSYSGSKTISDMELVESFNFQWLSMFVTPAYILMEYKKQNPMSVLDNRLAILYLSFPPIEQIGRIMAIQNKDYNRNFLYLGLDFILCHLAEDERNTVIEDLKMIRNNVQHLGQSRTKVLLSEDSNFPVFDWDEDKLVLSVKPSFVWVVAHSGVKNYIKMLRSIIKRIEGYTDPQFAFFVDCFRKYMVSEK